MNIFLTVIKPLSSLVRVNTLKPRFSYNCEIQERYILILSRSLRSSYGSWVMLLVNCMKRGFIFCSKRRMNRDKKTTSFGNGNVSHQFWEGATHEYLNIFQSQHFFHWPFPFVWFHSFSRPIECCYVTLPLQWV